jgi:Kef-type K+ transport system membrane component KefB
MASNTAVHDAEQLLFFVLAQLIVILVAARTAGYLARRMGQARAVGEIVGGLLLGPSLFGFLFPNQFEFLFHSVPASPVSIISQLGLILLMFQIGMDFDFSHLGEKRNRNAVTAIALSCIIVPFALGFAIGMATAPRLAPDIAPLPYALFLGTALSITAVPILGRIMVEFDLTRTRIGAVTISAAAINDVVGWLTLAAITALSTASFSTGSTLAQVGALAVYGAACWWVARPLLHRAIQRFSPDHGQLSPNLMAIMLVFAFASSIATQAIGIFAIFGGFMMGVLLHDQHKFVTVWKKYVGSFVLVFFLPVFFTYTGLRTNIIGLDSPELWMWCLIVIVAATAGKIGAAYLAARASGLDHHQGCAIGIMMNTRALMELIVLNVGFDLGFIPQNVFTMLVIMAVFSTIITAPALRRILPRMGHAIPHGIDA